MERGREREVGSAHYKCNENRFRWEAIFISLFSNEMLKPEVSWVKFCFDFSVTGQSEDGADQDSPEEGTPASPRSKRRVGRPGRKRKQLLPVSTAITGWRQPFRPSSGVQRRVVCSPLTAASPCCFQQPHFSPIQSDTMLTANTTQSFVWTHTHIHTHPQSWACLSFSLCSSLFCLPLLL